MEGSHARETELNIPPEEVDEQRKRAIVAAGLGWGLDGFDWTMFGYALPAITTALSLSESQGPFLVAFSLVASAFGGVVGGTLADRYGRVRVLPKHGKIAPAPLLARRFRRASRGDRALAPRG